MTDEILDMVAPSYAAAFALVGAVVLVLAIILTTARGRREKARGAKAVGSHGAHSAAPSPIKRMGFGFGTQFWPGLFAVLLVIFAVCLYKGMVGLGVVRAAEMCAAVTALGLLTYLRVPIHNGLDGLYLHGAAGRHASRFLVLIRDIVILLACTVLLFLLAEYPWNSTIATTMSHHGMAVECLIILAGLITLYFLGQRRGHLCVLGAVFITLVGLGQYFVLKFKNTAILPSDLLALSTAADVSGRFEYILDHGALVALCCGVLAIFLMAFLVPNTANRHRGAHVALRLVLGLACAVGCFAGLTRVDFHNDLGFEISYWAPIINYREQGFLPSFIRAAQDLPIEVPANYTSEGAAELQASYAAEYDRGRGGTQDRAAAVSQYRQSKPSVIVIMNEAYSNLAIYDGLEGGYDGPSYTCTKPADALVRGALSVSTLGGGTCNTEFEFLTGNSMAYIGQSKTPYLFYSMEGIDSLPKQFAADGYQTLAIHPAKKSNWNRDSAYPSLGFDEFWDIEQFSDAETYHGAVSDWATYEPILERLSTCDDPLFVFDVTMQNHSGYRQFNIPESDQLYVAGAGLGQDLVEQSNEFVSCVEESDRALERFIGQLKELDEPVVVVFFGDHQPAFASDLNEQLFSDQPTPQYLSNESWTPYLVWANYDVAGSLQIGVGDDTSANYLGAMLLDAIGADLTDFQKAQLALRSKIPSVCAYGYQTIDRVWHCEDFEVESVQAAFEDLRTIQYLNFAEKV